MLSTSQKLRQAVQLVAADIRNSYPDMSDAQAIAHARRTIALEEVDGDDDDRGLVEAYRTVLSWEDESGSFRQAINVPLLPVPITPPDPASLRYRAGTVNRAMLGDEEVAVTILSDGGEGFPIAVQLREDSEASPKGTVVVIDSLYLLLG